MAGFWRAIFNTFRSRDNPRFGRPAKPYDPTTRRLPNVIRQREQREERERLQESGETDYRFRRSGEAGLSGNSRFARRGDPPLPTGADGEQEQVWEKQGANDQEIETLEELRNRFNAWPSYENWLAYAGAQEELGMRPDWAEFREKYDGFAFA